VKKIGTLLMVGAVVVGSGLLWNALSAEALPVGLNDAALVLKELPSAGADVKRTPASHVAVQQIPVEIGELSPNAMKRAEALRQAGLRLDVPERAALTSARVSPLSTSDEICVNVLRNPQLDVVEFGDDTGDIEYWSILYNIVFYTDKHYTSPSYSVSMWDEPEGLWTDTDDFWGTGLDYDMFGQAFWTPQNMTRLTVWFSSAYNDWNEGDTAWANLVVLTDEGYVTPDGFEVVVEIPFIAEATWENWYWDITAEDHPLWMRQMSNRPLAILYDHLSDRQAPYQRVRLDDLQVTVCYQREASAVYLPLVRRDPPADPGPRCIPREPDSAADPGFMTLDATCSNSFSALDQDDYYALDRPGVGNVRLRLFDLPSGSNWDALVYENVAGYPLICYIGTPGDAAKAKDCTLDPNKNYLVRVHRGAFPPGGTYKMRVERP